MKIKLLLRSCLSLALLSSFSACCATDISKIKQSSMSVCEVVRGGKDLAGKLVRVRARYHTDFFHGAWLDDAMCPGIALSVGADSGDADQSVEHFDATLNEQRYNKEFRFVTVDVSGKLNWEEAVTINAKLSQEKRLTIPAHLTLSFERVWDFGNVH